MVLTTWTLLIKPISCKKENLTSFPLGNKIRDLNGFPLNLLLAPHGNSETYRSLAEYKLEQFSKPKHLFIREEVSHVTYTNDNILVPIVCTNMSSDSRVILSQIGVFNIKMSMPTINFPLMGEVSISWIQKSTDMKTNYNHDICTIIHI